MYDTKRKRALSSAPLLASLPIAWRGTAAALRRYVERAEPTVAAMEAAQPRPKNTSGRSGWREAPTATANRYRQRGVNSVRAAEQTTEEEESWDWLVGASSRRAWTSFRNSSRVAPQQASNTNIRLCDCALCAVHCPPRHRCASAPHSPLRPSVSTTASTRSLLFVYQQRSTTSLFPRLPSTSTCAPPHLPSHSPALRKR